MKTLAATASLLALSSVTALACPICFGMESGPVTDGIRAAVIVLIGVTACVLGGFGVFIRRFVRRTSGDPE